ncbi:MAG: hypothetical protein IT566_03395, partial [Rhodospirillaceae bacterium]|nr:hypothetical protein [Rhodospirillaceae bacterium]
MAAKSPSTKISSKGSQEIEDSIFDLLSIYDDAIAEGVALGRLAKKIGTVRAFGGWALGRVYSAMINDYKNIPTPEEVRNSVAKYNEAINSSGPNLRDQTDSLKQELEEQRRLLKFAATKAAMEGQDPHGESFLPTPRALELMEYYNGLLGQTEMALAGIVIPAANLKNINVDLSTSMDIVTTAFQKQGVQLSAQQQNALSYTQAIASLSNVQQEAFSGATQALEKHLDASLTDAAKRVDAGLKVYDTNLKLAETISYITSLTNEKADADARAAKAAEEAAQKMQKVWEDAGNEIFGVWEGNWKSLLKGNLDAFDGFGNSVLGIGRKVANGLLEQIGGALAQSGSGLFSALLGGVGGGTSGGLLGLLNGTGFTPTGGWSGLFNSPTMATSVLPNFAQSQWGAFLGLSQYGNLTNSQAATIMANTGVQLHPTQLTTTGQAFNNLTSGWGIAGSMAGSALSNLLFTPRQGPGSQIGGTIGSIAGSFIPVPFLGTAVGSFIGSTVGGLFGPRPSDRTEGLTFDLTSGAEHWGNLGPNKRDPNNEAMARVIHTQVGAFYQALAAAGLRPGAADGLIQVGSGNSLAPFQASLGASGVQNFQTQDQAFAFLTQGLLDSLTDVPEELQGIIDSFDPTNIQAFIQALNTATPPDIGQGRDPSALAKFMEPIQDQLAQALDPRKFELDKLTAQFTRLRTEAEELGATTEQLQSIRQLEGIQRDQINERYDAPFNDMMKTVRSDIAQAADPEQWELDQLDAHYEEMQELAEGHNAELEQIDVWYGQQRTKITEKYAAEALVAAEKTAAEHAARVQTAMDRVMEQARATISSRLKALAEERRIIEENASKYRGLLANIKSAQARFARDPRISPTSNEQRLSDLMTQLNAAYAKAQNGDEEAAEEIADLAMAAAEANVAYNASSEEAARVQSQIATILSNTSNLANRELQIAQLNLDANDAQVDLLEQLLEKMGQPAQRTPATAADLEA